MPVPSQKQDVNCHGLVFNESSWEVIVLFVDIGGIVDHRCLNFIFITIFEPYIVFLVVDFQSWKKHTFLNFYFFCTCTWKTINWTFLQSLVPIDPVVSGRKIKMYKFMDDRQQHGPCWPQAPSYTIADMTLWIRTLHIQK